MSTSFYKQGMLGKAFAVIMLVYMVLLVVYLALHGSRLYAVLALIGTMFLFWGFLAGFFKLVIVINDQDIRVDFGGFARPKELNWDEIVSVVETYSYMGLHIYELRSNTQQKKSITFGSIVANYKHLLQEIMERAPQAIVDESIKKVLKKSK